MGSPLEDVIQLLNGYRISQTFIGGGKAGRADHLAYGPKTPDELAVLVSVKPGPLYQVLRFCASYGVFAEDDAGNLRTRRCQNVCATIPGSCKIWRWPSVNGTFLLSEKWSTPSRPESQLLTKDLTTRFFDYLSAHQELGEVFNSLMTSLYQREVEATLKASDSPGRLLDVGGGRGTVIRALMARFLSLDARLTCPPWLNKPRKVSRQMGFPTVVRLSPVRFLKPFLAAMTPIFSNTCYTIGMIRRALKFYPISGARSVVSAAC